MITYSGGGIINTLINKLPFEAHLPGYSYCGPGTKLKERLARGDVGINPLDVACREHDIAYDENKDLDSRHKADEILQQKAFDRARSKDARFSEKAAAFAVGTAMKVKRKLGMGLKTKQKNRRKKNTNKRKIKKVKVSGKKRRKFTLKKIINAAKRSMTTSNPLETALAAARTSLREAGGKKHVKVPRIIPVSTKTGGFLPLIPILASLSAIGSLAGGTAAITRAIQDAKAAKENNAENKRHNKTMEAIAIGKGLYLKPWKTGYGIQMSKNFQRQSCRKGL